VVPLDRHKAGHPDKLPRRIGVGLQRNRERHVRASGLALEQIGDQALHAFHRVYETKRHVAPDLLVI
jgi:hypothetical protein